MAWLKLAVLHPCLSYFPGVKLLAPYELKSKLKTMPNLHDYNMDENIIHAVN